MNLALDYAQKFNENARRELIQYCGHREIVDEFIKRFKDDPEGLQAAIDGIKGEEIAKQAIADARDDQIFGNDEDGLHGLIPIRDLEDDGDEEAPF